MITVTDISLESTDKDVLLSQSTEVGLKHPEHISIVTAQVETFMILHLVGAAVFKKFRRDPNDAGIVALRYPPHERQSIPLTINNLFQRYPERENYDAAYQQISGLLVSVSPSLIEEDTDETAFSIFEKNDRDNDIENFLIRIFQQEGISKSIYQAYLNDLIQEFPKSDQAGIITQIFLPKTSSLDKVLYRSKPYGIRFYDTDPAPSVLDFFEAYQQGVCEEMNPQLRFLVSGLISENGFEHNAIHIYRYSCIPGNILSAYAAYVAKVVEKMFMEHIKEKNILEIKENSLLKPLDAEEKETIIFNLSLSYIDKNNPEKALSLFSKLPPEKQQEIFPLYLKLLIANNKLDAAEKEIATLAQADDRNKCYLLLVLVLTSSPEITTIRIDEILKNMSSGNEKNMVLLMCSSILNEESYQEQINDEFATDLDALYELLSPGSFFEEVRGKEISASYLMNSSGF